MGILLLRRQGFVHDLYESICDEDAASAPAGDFSEDTGFDQQRDSSGGGDVANVQHALRPADGNRRSCEESVNKFLGASRPFYPEKPKSVLFAQAEDTP